MTINSPTHGKKIVLIDKEDMHKIQAYTWRLRKSTAGCFYAVAHTPMINGKRTVVNMHTLILNERFIDHINGNGLDNRKSNLRSANHKTNAQNRTRLRKNKTSQFKGVFFWKQSKLTKPWKACIVVNKKRIDLGFFETELDAAKVYNTAALKYFGKFAAINNL